MKNMKKIISLALIMLMILPSCVSVSSAAFTFDESLLYPTRTVTKIETYRVTKGVTEGYLVLNNLEGDSQVKCYLLDIDLSNPDLSVVTGYKNADGSVWDRGTVRDHTKEYEAKYGGNVVGGVNGDFYNIDTGEPIGYFVMQGVTYHPDKGRPYFAVLEDGTAVIRYSWESKEGIKEAVGGGRIIIRDGVPVTDGVLSGTDNYPRSAVGIKADGSVVFFVADGRQNPDSCGMYNDDDLAATLHALGCVQALTLDGGGSTTLVGERECISSMAARNTPSYAGIERPVSTSLLVHTVAEPTGIFDHLSFSEPEIDVYPGDSVIIKYAGCDENGYQVDLPAGKLVLEDSTCGELKAGLIFKASETNEGKTRINYVTDEGEILGGIDVVVSKEALSTSQKIGNLIGQVIFNLFNLFRTLVEKIGEKTGWYTI